MTRILEKWLLLLAILHICIGIALPFIAYSDSFTFYADHIRQEFWHGAPIPAPAEAFQRWIIALFGPTIASWGVLMACLVRAGQNTTQAWPWNGLLLSILIWAPADIAISLLHHFWIHVLIDVIAVLAIVIPAWLLRKQRRT